MKKVLLGAILLGSVLSAKSINLQTIQNLPIVKQSQLKIVKFQELDDIYHVKGSPLVGTEEQKSQLVEFFLTKNFEQLILGRGIQTIDNQPVRFPVDVSLIEGKEAISYGTGKEVIYVFTDPECPYCKKLELELPKLKDRYTFKIYLFPLPFHKQAIPMSKYILAGATEDIKFDRMLEIANGSTKFQDFQMSQKENTKYQSMIDTQIELGKKAEINATPSTTDKNGVFVDWSRL